MYRSRGDRASGRDYVRNKLCYSRYLPSDFRKLPKIPFIRHKKRGAEPLFLLNVSLDLLFEVIIQP